MPWARGTIGRRARTAVTTTGSSRLRPTRDGGLRLYPGADLCPFVPPGLPAGASYSLDVSGMASLRVATGRGLSLFLRKSIRTLSLGAMLSRLG